ncbi:hypothetical protein KC19_12G146400 [Ceratodon purpureus]|uniref:Vacuolar amino acid transporter YPQ1 n=1 Tax=Ceratodon purpureus TaxID=3225 RepID=A0A8T0G9T3_CERPU|nr:hypothetical protein KC19_12G146400 [Ceratodon purpureus]
MEGVFGPLPQCPAEKPCLKWVQIYLLDCVCSTRDRFSLALGLMSVLSWGVAEVPQILTNFREKSTEGVSLLFLMTWVVGDVFNLLGCYLEPATLPTQFYMATLYTLTTIILVLQTIYYDHIVRWWANDRVEVEDLFPEVQKTDMEAQKPISIPESANGGPESISPQSSQPTSIRVPHHQHIHGSSPGSRDHLYIQSARSLASSYAQPIGSYNVPGSRGSTGGHHNSYLLTREDSEPPPLVGSRPRRLSTSSLSTSAIRTVASGVLLVGSLGISLYTSPRIASGGSTVGTTNAGRDNLRLGDPFLGEEPSPLGEVFGWIMACIYMGGRLPQIWLNIKRGTVEGLNPLMFVFALLGNLTYVGSILVRSMEWAQLKPNLAWLVDAGVCVILDIFILCQFVYYYSKMEDAESSEEESWPYKPLN